MNRQTTFAPDDWRGHSPDFCGETFARNLAVVEQLGRFATDRGLTLVELAVAWTLCHPAVHVVIVGARRPAQLEGSIHAADVKLTEDDQAEIDRILAPAAPVHGPNPEGM
jgi:aryl-alcohol dehydrogenase-like predicted oxidoreductase